MHGSRLKRLSHTGFENCFEITVKSGEGRLKQYVFGAETDASCSRWIEVLTAVINTPVPPGASPNPAPAPSSAPVSVAPGIALQAHRNDSVESVAEGETINVLHLAASLNGTPAATRNSGGGSATTSGNGGGKTMSGYLLKESPVDGRGFQKRYFVLRGPGELVYFMKVSSEHMFPSYFYIFQ